MSGKRKLGCVILAVRKAEAGGLQVKGSLGYDIEFKSILHNLVRFSIKIKM